MAEDNRDSGTSRDLLLDAAETLMREEGYAAVTSRRVAAQAGLKPQLVHYHFKTMEDLFLEVFRRLADEIVTRQRAVENSARPLRAMWDVFADSRYRLLIYEFVALSNHRKRVRTEFVQFGDEIRQLQTHVMARVLKEHGLNSFPWTPGFASVLLHSLARFLSLESELGVSEGHADAQRVVDYYIDQYDTPSPMASRIASLEAENAALRLRLGDLNP